MDPSVSIASGVGSDGNPVGSDVYKDSADFKHEFLLAIEDKEDQFNIVPLFQYNNQPGHVLSSNPGMSHTFGCVI